MAISTTNTDKVMLNAVPDKSKIMCDTEKNRAFLSFLSSVGQIDESHLRLLNCEFGSEYAMFAMRLDSIFQSLAAKVSADYKDGVWRFNEHGIYILDSTMQTYKAKGFRCESQLNGLEFSLCQNINVYKKCIGSEISREVKDLCWFMYHYSNTYCASQDNNKINVRSIMDIVDI